MIEFNLLLILALGVVSMILGAIWYGPLFGKAWARLNGVDPNNKEAMKAMAQGMTPVYIIQFVLTTFMVFVVYAYTKPAADVMNEITGAIWLWAGIVVPVLASAIMWTNEPKKKAKKRFLIQAGYMLLLYLIIGYTVMTWG